MQSISWQKGSALRTVVIAILLVFVFEMMLSQPDLAFSHALIADRLLCNFITEHPTPYTHTIGLASPVSGIIEDELLLTFCRLDTQQMTFMDGRTLEIHQRGKLDGSETVARMPTLFTDLKEATLYWEVVMRRTGHFIFSAAGATQAFRLENATELTIPGRTLVMSSATFIYSSPYLVPEGLREERDTYLVDIDRWSGSFAPLMELTYQASSHFQEIAAVSILRMHALNTKIITEGTTFTSECSYDKLFFEFQEIIALARIVDDRIGKFCDQQPSYHFHLNVVPPLFVLLLRCRDRDLRRDALELLRKSQIDGPWDRFMVAKIGEWIMEIEDDGCDETSMRPIPEHARVKLTKVIIGMEEKKVVVQCVKRTFHAGLPSLEWKETVLTDW